MAKRFIDSNLFKKNFIRGLKAPSKLLWIYLFCDCDNSGVWEIDYEIASIFTGAKVDLKELEKFNDKIIIFDNGKKVFIPDFISFQYGELNPNNPAHKGVIKELSKYQLIDDNFNLKIKELQSSLKAPYIGAKDMDMDMDMDSLEKFEKPFLKSEPIKTWRDDFDIYKSELNEVYKQLLIDSKFISQQEKFHPGLDISLSLEKAYTNFWSTEAGWKHKKKSRSNEIDWKSTLTKAIDMNKVYKQRFTEQPKQREFQRPELRKLTGNET